MLLIAANSPLQTALWVEGQQRLTKYWIYRGICTVARPPFGPSRRPKYQRMSSENRARRPRHHRRRRCVGSLTRQSHHGSRAGQRFEGSRARISGLSRTLPRRLDLAFRPARMAPAATLGPIRSEVREDNSQRQPVTLAGCGNVCRAWQDVILPRDAAIPCKTAFFAQLSLHKTAARGLLAHTYRQYPRGFR
jgi:hypothetical protein